MTLVMLPSHADIKPTSTPAPTQRGLGCIEYIVIQHTLSSLYTHLGYLRHWGSSHLIKIGVPPWDGLRGTAL